MRAYVGQTRSRKLIADLASRGIGECFTRGTSYWPPRRTPWFYDNGAFSDWHAGRPFDAAAFESDLDRIREASGYQPDFIVCPDVVAGGRESLAFSLSWLPSLRSRCPGQRLYLAVQNGLEPDDVPPATFQGVFVGGTRDWKLDNAQRWIAWAHARALPCHIGRIGTGQRVLWARLIGADSFDSSLPLWGANNLRIFYECLFGAGPMRRYRRGDDEGDAFLRAGRQTMLRIG